jgi:hypothetical protein
MGGHWLKQDRVLNITAATCAQFIPNSVFPSPPAPTAATDMGSHWCSLGEQAALLRRADPSASRCEADLNETAQPRMKPHVSVMMFRHSTRMLN